METQRNRDGKGGKNVKLVIQEACILFCLFLVAIREFTLLWWKKNTLTCSYS